MRDSNTGGTQSIQEIEKLRRRVAKLEQVNRELTKSQSPDPNSEKTQIQWERTFDAIKDMIIVLDNEFKIVRANQAISHFAGKPLKEIIGKICCQVMHGTDIPPNECPFRKAQSSKKHEEVELYVPEQDIWLEAVVDPIIDESGIVSSAIHVIRDITDRRKTEEALRKSEEQHRSIFTGAVDGIIYADRKANIVDVNPAFTEITGIPCQEVVGKSAFSLVRRFAKSKDIPKLLKAVSQALKGKPIGLYELEINNKIVEVSTPSLKKGSVGITGVIRDVTERYKAKEQLLKSEENYRILVENAQEAIFTVDPDGVFLFMNGTAAREMGGKPEDFMGKTMWDLFPPDVAEFQMERIREIIRMGKGKVGENETILPRGVRWYRTSSQPLRNCEGDIYAVMMIGTDVTERKKAEEALKVSEKCFKDIFDSTLIGLYQTTPDGRILMANPALVRMLGYASLEELATRNLEQEGFEPDYPRSQFKERIETDGKVVGLESVWIKRDGTTLFVRESTQVIRDSSGNTLYYQGTVEDITERKRVQDALKASETKYMDLYENAPDMYASVNAKTAVIEQCNYTLANTLGYSKEEIIGQSVFDIYHPDCLEEVKKTFRLFVETGEIHDKELQLRKKDGSKLHVTLNVSAVCDKSGHILYSRSILHDITKRKQAEEKMLRSDQRLRLHSEQSLLGFLEWDENFCAIEWNAACERIFGYTREEAIGRHAKDLILPPEVHELVDGIYHSLMNQTGGQHSINENVTKDGRIITCEWFNTTLIDKDGKAIGVASVCSDITERIQAEQERLANLHFFESMDRINQAIQGTNDLEQMMSDVLDEVLSIFDCDRAWFVYPCDPTAASWCVPMERTKPDYPGALALGFEVPIDSDVIRVYRAVLASDGPVQFHSQSEHPLPAAVAEQFSEQSQIAMALYPKGDKPYMFGLHQCSYVRVWTQHEERLLLEIGRRFEDALTSLIIFRDLRESEEKFKKVYDQSPIAKEIYDSDGFLIDVNPECLKLFGVKCLDDVKGFKLFDDPNLPEDAKELLLQNIPVHYETEFSFDLVKEKGLYATSKSGKAFLNVRITSLCDLDDKVTGYLVQVEDITERKRTEQERFANLHFFESMDRINRAIQGTNDLEQMMSNVMDEVLTIFNCDRAFLLYPCDPESPSWRAHMERTRPEYPGALAIGFEGPMDPDVVKVYSLLLESDGPVAFDPESAHPLPQEMSKLFGYQSQILMAIYPKKGSPWVFGLHQCSYPRVWTQHEERLLQEIGRRLEDALTSLIIFRDLRESEERFRSIFDNANDIIVFVTKYGKMLKINPTINDILGYDPEELIGKNFMTCGILSIKNAATIVKLFKEAVKLNGFPHKQNRDITEVWLNHKDGYAVLLEANTTIIRKDKKMEGFLSILRDVTEARKAQEAYRSLVDHSLQGLAIFQEGRVVFANQAMAKITGYSIEEMLDAPPEKVQAFVHSEDRELVWNRHKERLEGKILPERYEIRGIRKDGSTRWLEIEACMVEYQGKPAIQAAYIDITERKEAGEALRESEERYRSLFESTLEGLISADAEGKIVSANPSAATILGYESPQDLIGRHTIEFYEDPKQRGIVLKRIAENGYIEDYELTVKRKDGARAYLLVSMTIENDEQGNLLRSDGMFHDITDRKKTETALQVSEERLRMLAETIEDVFWVSTPGVQEMVYISPSYETIWGRSRESLYKTPLSFMEVVHPEDRSWLSDIFEEKHAHGKPYHCEYRIIPSDGQLRWISERGFPAFDEQGNLRYMTGVCTDITERKQNEQKLRAIADYTYDWESWFGVDGSLLWLNPAVEKLTGYSIKECHEMSDYPLPIVHQEDRMSFGKRLQKAIAERSSINDYYFRVCRKDDTICWMAISWQPIYDEKSEHIGLRTSVRDITERKRAEEALRDSEKILNDTGKMGRIGGWKHDLVSGKAVWTQALYDIIEIPYDQEPPGVDEHLSYYPAHDRKILKKAYNQAVNNGTPFNLELQVYTSQKKLIWCRAQGEPMYEDGKCVAMRGTFQDVTERRRAEEALRTSEARLSEAMKIAKLGYWEYDVGDNVFIFNDQFYSVYRSSVEQVGGYRVSPSRYAELFLHPDDALELGEEIRRAIETNDPNFKREVEHHIIFGDGNIGYVSVRYFIVKDNQGRTIKTHGVNQDITEQKKAEESLRENEAFLNTLLEAIPIPVFYKDRSGKYLGFNSAFEEFFGAKREALIGKTTFDINPKELAEFYHAKDIELFEGGGVQQYESQVVNQRSMLRDVVINKAIYSDNQGGNSGLIGTILDITNRKQAEDRLHQYQDKLKAMALERLMAEEHERQRIAIGFHDDICQKLVISKFTLDSSLKSVSDANMSKSLRIVSEAIGKTIQKAEWLTFELSNPILREFGLVAAMEKYLEEEIRQKHGISYDIQSDEQLGTLRNEIKTILFRIVKELLTNVVKHAQAGKISMSIRKYNQKICVRIQDDGVGFKDADVNSKTPRAVRFGLFSVREQLDHLGGTLSIVSKPGQGTTATVVVPLEDK